MKNLLNWARTFRQIQKYKNCELLKFSKHLVLMIRSWKQFINLVIFCPLGPNHHVDHHFNHQQHHDDRNLYHLGALLSLLLGLLDADNLAVLTRDRGSHLKSMHILIYEEILKYDNMMSWQYDVGNIMIRHRQR